VSVAPWRTIPYVADTMTNRLVLHPIDEIEAERILGGVPTSADAWAPGYPFEGDLTAVGGQLAATVAGGDQRPWGYYQVRRREDGLAIGGIGFAAPPDASGTVEVGYGLIPDARGKGYAAEALRGMIAIARANGAQRVIAETASNNIASQRTLRNVGMPRTGSAGDTWRYELALTPA
jgi:RimJ/RimL family protein N-acetyltransferase